MQFAKAEGPLDVSSSNPHAGMKKKMKAEQNREVTGKDNT